MATDQQGSPFLLDRADAYTAWRDARLAAAPTRLAELLVEIDDPRRLSGPEREAIMTRVARANMAVYASNTAGLADGEIPRRLGSQLGLHTLDRHYLADDDGISALTVARMAASTSSGEGQMSFR